MTQAGAFLIWLLCVGISAILIGYFIKQSLLPVKHEGFVVHRCPRGTTTFITRHGETQCCNGDVVNGYCRGNLKCTLSPRSKSGLPKCDVLAKQEAAEQGKHKCPRQMPNYFASLNGSLRGCSVSQSTSDGTSPSDPNQPQCILYSTQSLDQVKLDSCYNYLQNIQAAAKYASLKSAATQACPTIEKAGPSIQKVASAPKVAPTSKVAPVPQMASAPKVATVKSKPNPTGYVMFGDWISGTIPVQKVIPFVFGMVIYLAQDGDYIKYVATNNSNNSQAKYIIGKLSNFTVNNYEDFTNMVNALGNTLKDANGHYKVKKL